MYNLSFDLKKNDGRFKIMHAVNNGPVHKRHAVDQLRSNFIPWKTARIPLARNHDASYCGSYGGEHSVDITAIFPDFSKDPYDPASYDFVCTDEYVLATLEAGTKTFFRLGQKIEHYIKKYGTLPPPDFKKWAIICEHIIKHYTEDFADGLGLDIEYWEIWNEPDLDPDDCTHKRTWGGTQAEFYDFFEISAKHLKSCFPHLKIGGPALATPAESCERYLKEMQKREIPVDFLSWHIYTTDPVEIIKLGKTVRDNMIKYGYGDKESILNEWNYVKGWVEEFTYSIKQIIGIKGAAFTLATMSAAQNSDIDMLMYYDARPCAFNGLFDIYTFEPLKGYYPFLWFADLYDCEKQVICRQSYENIYTLCGVTKDGKALATVCYYNDNDALPDIEVSIDFKKSGKYEIFALDSEHSGELLGVYENLDFTLSVNTAILIKEI